MPLELFGLPVLSMTRVASYLPRRTYHRPMQSRAIRLTALSAARAHAEAERENASIARGLKREDPDTLDCLTECPVWI